MNFNKSSHKVARLEVPLAPLLSIAFLSLMFFALSWKTVSAERACVVNLPISAPANHAPIDQPKLNVELRSDQDGRLTQLRLNGKQLGSDHAAFERLNQEILAIVGRSGNPLDSDLEVELDADFECQHKYVVKAISYCTGRFDPQTQQVARYVEKITFAPPHKPKPSASRLELGTSAGTR